MTTRSTPPTRCSPSKAASNSPTTPSCGYDPATQSSTQSRVYQEYTSQGWITAPSVSLPADAGTKLLTSPDEIDIDERQRLDISVELLGRTDRVIPAAAVHALDYQAEVEVLEPLSWDVPLAGSPAKLAELPEDLREFAFMLRERLMKLATDSPIYSPPDTANVRPPFTLNTQPVMTFDEVSSVIRQMQSNVDPYLQRR